MKCKICASECQSLSQARILQKYDIRYYFCSVCEFLQTEPPYWLTEAYADAINRYDTGILSRNIRLSAVVAVLIYFLFSSQRRFVDYAGGYGLFTRLMRDRGFDFYWSDPYSQNLLARGFEYGSTQGDIAAVTCFEAFEHFADPLSEIERIIAISPNIIFTTALTPEPLPKPQEWWYFGLEHGQHIAFYRPKTLRLIAERFHLEYHTNHQGLHLFTRPGLRPQLLPCDLHSLSRLGEVFLRLDTQSSLNPLKRHFTRLLNAIGRLTTILALSRPHSGYPDWLPDLSSQRSASMERFLVYLTEDSEHLLRRYVDQNLPPLTLKDMHYLIGHGAKGDGND